MKHIADRLRWPGTRPRVAAAMAITTALALTVAGCRPGTPIGDPGTDEPGMDSGTTNGAAPDGSTSPNTATSAPATPAEARDLAGDARALGGLAIVLDLQWQSVGRQTQALAASVGVLCNEPSVEHLEQARQSWRLARRAWMEAQVYEIGPMPGLRLKAQMDWWPANPERMEALIAGDEDLTPEFIGRQGSTVKGLFALERLLWAPDRDDAALLTGLDAAGGPAAERRCRYAAGAAEAMDRSWRQADAIWRGSPSGEAAPGAGTATATAPTARPSSTGGGLTPPLQHFASRQEAINAVVNRLVFVSQELDGMLAKPLGRRTGGTPQPETAQGTLSGSTVASVVDGLCGIRALWIGDRSAHCTGQDTAAHEAVFPALGELVRARSPETANHVSAALDAAIAAVQGLPEPFTSTLAQDPARVEAAFQAEKALERALSTEVVGVLGVNLTFNANDGD